MPIEPSGRHLAIGETEQVTVDPANKYGEAGLSVRIGEQYSFSARGKWKDGSRICDAAGWCDGWLRMFMSFNRVPNRPYFLLCGMVGRDDRHAFPIGVQEEWAVSDDLGGDSGGCLYLFANDIPFMYANNRALDESEGGPLRVWISRIK